MRPLVLALVLVATSSSVRADELEDPDYAGFPTFSPAIGVQRHARGIGPSLELALGSERWQYFVEGSLDRVITRGAIGVRWLARQFTPTARAGIELLVIATAGAQRISDTMATSPEVSVGPGLQLRQLEVKRFAIRLDARAVFTDSPRTTFLTGMTVAW